MEDELLVEHLRDDEGFVLLCSFVEITRSWYVQDQLMVLASLSDLKDLGVECRSNPSKCSMQCTLFSRQYSNELYEMHRFLRASRYWYGICLHHFLLWAERMSRVRPLSSAEVWGHHLRPTISAEAVECQHPSGF